jgi:hypothetical protein
MRRRHGGRSTDGMKKIVIAALVVLALIGAGWRWGSGGHSKAVAVGWTWDSAAVDDGDSADQVGWTW